MTGIILSGGESRRMAADKAFLRIGGEHIIERILRVFNELFDEIIIVTNTPELYVSYDAILVGDVIEKKGPMSGLYSGLLNSKNNYNFVVACDMPFLNRSLISFMMGLMDGADIVIPRIKGLVEPLHAIYSKSCLYLIESYLKDGYRGLRELLGGCKVRYVEEDELLPKDPEMRSLININTPGDLKKIKEKVYDLEGGIKCLE